jgi:aspartyl/asparaginyl-tRNA synthetase
MKKIVSISAFFFISFASSGQAKIPLDSLNLHIGGKVTVCAEVYGVKSTDKVTFIHLGKAYPNSPLTLVIFAKDRSRFSDSPEKLFGNKLICVTGVIKEYKSKTEMVVTAPDEISVQ